MGSRLHGNDGRPRVPTVIPAKPVLRISVIPFPRKREPGDGFPSPRERAARTYRTSHIRHSRAGRPLHNRHSREGGNPGVEGMGSRLHGNDGRQRVPTVIPINPELHISVIPAQEDPCTTVIPATAGIQGRRGWVPVSTGTTGGSASLPSFPSTQNFTYPSFPRRKTPAQPSFPRKREPGAAGMGSRLHGNDGRPRVPTVIPAKPVLRISVIPAQEDPCTTVIPAKQPSFPRRESRGGGDGFPSPRERRAAPRLRHNSTSPTRAYRSRATSPMSRSLHNHHSRRIPVIPTAQPSFPRRRESRGGGDGFPSPRERRVAPHPVSAASPPLRREYIVSTFTRTGRRRAWRRRSRSGAAPACPRASPARRRRRSARASAPSCRSASGSRPS